MKQTSLSTLLVVIITIALSGCAASPKPDVVTFWNKMGIPQAYNSIHGNLINRKGNHPQWEKKPPLKAIADPANLESPNPAIKAAAEIKVQEDLAQQKVKALAYLGSIGCGCYDKEGKMEAALLAGLEDCTEDVRLAAAQAIVDTAASCCCSGGGCNYTSCCSEAVQNKLEDMAWGETDGCWHEPSAEVRQLAQQAFSACPPLEQPDVNPENVPTVPAESVYDFSVPLPSAPKTDVTIIKENYYAPVNVGFSEEVTTNLVSTKIVEEPAVYEQSYIAPVITKAQAVLESTPITDSLDPTVLAKSMVEYIDVRESAAVIDKPEHMDVLVDDVLSVRVLSRRGQEVSTGYLHVVEVKKGFLKVRPMEGLVLSQLRAGASLEVLR